VIGEILGIVGWHQCPGIFLAKSVKIPVILNPTGEHVDIFRFCLEAYSIDSSKMTGNSPEVSNFNRLVLRLNRFICD
jgi:hypothetical protein